MSTLGVDDLLGMLSEAIYATALADRDWAGFLIKPMATKDLDGLFINFGCHTNTPETSESIDTYCIIMSSLTVLPSLDSFQGPDEPPFTSWPIPRVFPNVAQLRKISFV